MGVMQAFQCEGCSLAFEVGGYVHWDLTGCCERVVCLNCGTMQKIEERHGVCRVFALPGPIRSLPKVTKRDDTGYEYEDYQWPFDQKDWRLVGQAPGISTYEQRLWVLANLPCARCGTKGCLASLELPTGPAGEWPVFGERCPLCGGRLPRVYDSTIN